MANDKLIDFLNHGMEQFFYRRRKEEYDCYLVNPARAANRNGCLCAKKEVRLLIIESEYS